MSDWQLVVIGGALTIAASTGTELVKDWLTRNKQQRERHESFEQDALLALLDHLSELGAVTVIATHDRLNRDAATPEDERSLFRHLTQTTRYLSLTDDQTRRIVGDAITALGHTGAARTQEEFDERCTAASAKLAVAQEHIGDKLRAL